MFYGKDEFFHKWRIVLTIFFGFWSTWHNFPFYTAADENTNGHPSFVEVIDTKRPIVLQYGDGDAKRAPSYNRDEGAYFGYSLTFMKGAGAASPGIKFEDDDNGDLGTLFVGAPKESSLTKNSGTVWACKFRKDSKVLCYLLSDISEKPSRQECSRAYYNESETEQWIGASVSASNGYLYACAPRWKQNGYQFGSNCYDESPMTGACYFSAIRNDNAEGVELNNPFYRKENFHFQGYTETGKEIHEYWYFYAQFGMSSHVTWSENLVVGAPNVRKWAGSYVEYNHRGQPYLFNTRKEFNDIESHSLLGYSITSGRSRGRSYYVAVGAPRANTLRGMVTVSKSLTARPEGIFKGEQLGGYFGYSVATANLNGDENDNDELLVGAPWYTFDSKSLISYGAGCVFIFDVNLLPNSQPRRRLCAGGQDGFLQVTKGARFGSAIAKIGDLNDDGRDDFAIAAPYDDDGKGTVFIYYGGFELGERPVKIIRGRELNIKGLSGFGSHLLSSSGQVDIDGNETPDIAIGAYESQHVIILRTRPVARPSIKVTFHSANSSNNNGQISTLLPNQDRLRVRTCVDFHFSTKVPQETKLETWVKLELVDLKERRFQFDSSEKKQILSATETTCLNTIVNVVGDLTLEGDEEDAPIPFSVTISYNQTADYGLNVPVQHATVQITPNPTNRGQNRFNQDRSYESNHKSFQLYLPAPIPKTKSENALLSIAKTDCNADGNPQCDPNLKIEKEVLVEDIDGKLQPFLKAKKEVGKMKSILASLTLSNDGETASRPTVEISLSISDDFEVNTEELRIEWLQSPGRGRTCNSKIFHTDDINEGKTVIARLRCSRSLQNGRKYEYKLKINNLQTTIKVKDKLQGKIIIAMAAFPEGQPNERKEEKIKDPLFAEVHITVEHSVPTSGHTAIDRKNIELQQLYILKNIGLTSTFSERVIAEILIPAYIHTTKNVTKVLVLENPSTLFLRCVPENFEFFDRAQVNSQGRQTTINGAGVDNSPSSSRNTMGLPSFKVTYPETTTLSRSHDKIALSGCNTKPAQESASCYKITCYTDLLLKEGRDIHLHMRILPNALDDILNEDTKGISVESVIKVSFPGSSTATVGISERSFTKARGVPAYMYLLAGGIGSILFIIIAFVLYKCGFFKRKQKEQLQQLKRQTMHMENLGALDFSSVVDEPDEITG